MQAPPDAVYMTIVFTPYPYCKRHEGFNFKQETALMKGSLLLE